MQGSEEPYIWITKIKIIMNEVVKFHEFFKEKTTY
jgi:hypothetical protein